MRDAITKGAFTRPSKAMVAIALLILGDGIPFVMRRAAPVTAAAAAPSEICARWRDRIVEWKYLIVDTYGEWVD